MWLPEMARELEVISILRENLLSMPEPDPASTSEPEPAFMSKLEPIPTPGPQSSSGPQSKANTGGER